MTKTGIVVMLALFVLYHVVILFDDIRDGIKSCKKRQRKKKIKKNVKKKATHGKKENVSAYAVGMKTILGTDVNVKNAVKSKI